MHRCVFVYAILTVDVTYYSTIRYLTCTRLCSPTDIDECSEQLGICGKQTVCTNVPGTFYCSCTDGFFPSTGIIWTLGVSFCQSKLWIAIDRSVYNITTFSVHALNDLHMGTFSFFSYTDWTGLQDILDEIKPPEVIMISYTGIVV